MSQLGRITGPLLNANLHRDDIDLKISNTTFDATPVLFFDVGTSTVGIKTDDPNSDFALDVRTDTLTTRLQVDDTAKIDNVLIKAPNTFSTVVGPLHILPTKTAGSYMNFQRMRSDDLEFNDNTISGIISNQTIELDPSGTGTVEFTASSNIYGTLGVTGNITMDGNLTKLGDLTIGDELYNPDVGGGSGDVVEIIPDFSQSIIPGDDNTWDLGTGTLVDSSVRRWNNAYITDNLVNVDTPLPLEIRVSDQQKLDGVNNEIFSLQSNDDLVLAPDTGINIIEWTQWNEITATSTSASISGYTLTISGTIVGTFVPGMLLTGVGIIPGTIITGTSTGSDSAGTYTVNFNYDGSGSRPAPTGTISVSGATDAITNLTDIGGGPREYPETPLTFAGTGIGYLRFTDTNTFLVPAAGNADRPARPELGDSRWNTDRNVLEVFAGTIESVTGIAVVTGLPNQITAGLTGTTNGSGVDAEFTISIASGALTTITITTVGQGYITGDLITILGSSLTGGSTPANDIILTVGAQTDEGYQLSTGGGAEVDVPLMEDLSDVYSLMLG